MNEQNYVALTMDEVQALMDYIENGLIDSLATRNIQYFGTVHSLISAYDKLGEMWESYIAQRQESAS